MRTLAIVVLVAGCWTNSTTPPPAQPTEPRASRSARAHVPPPREPTPEEQALLTLADFTERMCECNDMPCAQQVSNDMTAWSVELGNGPRWDEEQTKRVADMGMRMGECMRRALTPAPAPGTPSPPPP